MTTRKDRRKYICKHPVITQALLRERFFYSSSRNTRDFNREIRAQSETRLHSSRNTRDFNREIRAQSETRLHREYNLAMKNKSLRRVAAAQRGRCFRTLRGAARTPSLFKAIRLVFCAIYRKKDHSIFL